MSNIMTQGDSFDHKLAEMYPSGFEARNVPKLPPEGLPILFDLMRHKLFGDALDDAVEVVGDKDMHYREIFARTEAWSATFTYAIASQDDRWSISDQMPMTDAFHADVTPIDLSQRIKDMFVGFHRMVVLMDAQDPPSPLMSELKWKGSSGVELSSALVRIFLSMGSRYGIEMTDRLSREAVQHHIEVSEEESSKINAGGGSLAMALFDDAQLRGAKEPSIDELAHFLNGVEQIVQLETTTAIIDTLGLLSTISPELQKLSFDFYKQHKAMLFGDKPPRTFQAMDKLLSLLKGKTAHYKKDSNIKLAEAARSAFEYLVEWKKLQLVLIDHTSTIATRIQSGWYESPSTSSEN